MDLNDDAEFRKGFAYFKQYCDRKYHDEKIAKMLMSYWTTVRKLQMLYANTPWIMSFSTERDSLSQWRAYTDRKRGGVAIGFDKAKLEDAILERSKKASNGFSICLLPCIYYDSGIDEATRPKAVVFSTFDSEEDVFRAIEAGACGYLSKQSSGA